MNVSPHDKYEPVIGLEVHAQLLTHSKIFCGDATAFGEAPNTNIGVITLGHPGTLPKLNRTAVEFAIRMGLACGSEISRWQIFDRKNYFYPDLPKGYQLTQDRTPICKGGQLEVTTKSGQKKIIRLHRIHLEEDAGKSIHLDGESDTALDFNRAGVPLIEIVTLPELHTSEEAYAFLAEVRKLVRYLDICDGNLEEGSLRCDANVSVRLAGSTTLGKKVEIKNMNSLRNVQHAIDYEIERQIACLERGELIVSETRTFQATDGKTYAMRTKEELNDYRYFPDPDLSPLEVDESWLKEIQAGLPLLPKAWHQRLMDTFGLTAYDASVITETREMAAYYESVCAVCTNYKAIANWLMGPVKSHLNETGLSPDRLPLAPMLLAEIIALVDAGTISFAVASQKVLPILLKHGGSAREVAESLNLVQDSRVDSIGAWVDEVIHEFPLKVEEYKNGKKGIIRMFMGEVMKRSGGKADPKVATELIEKKLSAL
jgi:aspartyl-tRNA(Asn)/glutamyl-tRNA(Gln) amidotransferase subunit B